MQSGITASEELHRAFGELVSNPSQRGLLVSIKDERLVPSQSIPSKTSDFLSDISSLSQLLKDNEASYVVLRRYNDGGLDPFVAVTYVPDSAPVRQKMLFASTRLTLTRELGSEKFRDTLFATTKKELTAEGFEKHDDHAKTAAPLTEEEQTLLGIKKEEAESSMGTSSRSSHVSSGVQLPFSEEAMEALRTLERGDDNLVQLKLDIPTETVVFAEKSTVDVEGLASAISDSDPRYSFYRYTHVFEGREESPIIFIYTCPTNSKVKERMLHASCRAFAVRGAEIEAGLTIAKRLEATSPAEITLSTLDDEFHPKREEKAAFSRPKRPGRR